MKREILDKKHLYLFWKLVVASLLYVLPIMLADRYYSDDLSRALKGATGWKGDGRPLGEYLILLLCGGRPVVDLSPFLLILSVVVLSFSLVLYAKENLEHFDDDHMKVLVLLFIITNPFAMSNLSYKFDCIIMFTALSLTFLAYAVPDKVSSVWLFLCAVVTGMLIMSFYQPAIAMCIVLFITAVFFYIMGEKKGIFKELARFFGLVTGAFLYKIIIAPHFVSADDWRHNASKVVSGLTIDSIKTVINNIANAFHYIGNYLRSISFLNRITLPVMIMVSFTVVIIKYISISKVKNFRKAVDIIFIVFAPLIVFVGTFLPLVVLETVDMRSRIFISFGGFLFFIGILLLHLAKKSRIIVLLLLLVNISFQYIYMYAYGNALKSQKEYESYLVYNIAHDLETINVDHAINTVSFDGPEPRSRQVRMICDKYPFFYEIVPVYLNNDAWLGGAWLNHYLQEKMAVEWLTDEDMTVIDSIEPVIDNQRYSCYVNNEKVIVQFH